MAYVEHAFSCRATGATALVKLAAPQPDELGFAKSLALEEIGGTNVVVLQQDASQGQVFTQSHSHGLDTTLPPYGFCDIHCANVPSMSCAAA